MILLNGNESEYFTHKGYISHVCGPLLNQKLLQADTSLPQHWQYTEELKQ